MSPAIPEGRDWGYNYRVRGRRMHIVDWEGSKEFGAGYVAVCGMEIDTCTWTDDNWKLQDANPSANPARPCPACVKEVS